MAEKMQEWLALYGMQVIGAAIIFFVGLYAARFSRLVVRKLMRASKIEDTLVSFVGNLLYFGIMTFVCIAALAKLGVQTASFIAVLGAAGLAVGLALQGSLANFAAGVLLIIFKPFRVGDFIEGGGISGVVEEVGIFTTEMRSPDNKKIIVPNNKMTSDSIVNYSAKDTRRVDIVAGVSYGDDLDKVKRVLQEIVAADERVLPEPAPVIAVLELAESSVNLVVRPWVKTSDYWDVYFAMQEQIKKRFDAEGISIPFPQRDVNLTQKN